MTIHVLIACSKTKSIPPSKQLIWKSKTTVKSWGKVWINQTNVIPANQLYNGRSFQQQLKISQENKDVRVHILSAGSGLISSIEMKIPSYEATFRKNRGPSITDWHLLPNGGIGKLKLKPNDLIVSFAPPQYHSALLNDPYIGRISSQLIVPSTSPLVSISKTVIQIHPRAKEVLGVASTDLNTEFLRVFLSEGEEGFERIQALGGQLPPKVERNGITDADLLKKVNELKKITTLDALVRHLRDDLLIKASYERISHARKLVSVD